MFKWFFDISTGFRFSKITVWECSVHSCSCQALYQRTQYFRKEKRDKNACDFSILNHFYWHIFFLLFYRRRTIPTILGSRPFLKSATTAVRTCWPCKSSSFSSTYSRTTALTFICSPTKWSPPCQGYVTKNNRYLIDSLTAVVKVSFFGQCSDQ